MTYNPTVILGNQRYDEFLSVAKEIDEASFSRRFKSTLIDIPYSLYVTGSLRSNRSHGKTILAAPNEAVE